MMVKFLCVCLLAFASVCQAGPRERIVIVNTLLRVRLESVPDLPNDFDAGKGAVPPPMVLLPPEQATTEPDDCFEAYLSPNCGPCEGFVKDWKGGQFRQYSVRAMGVWEGKAHPIFRWRVKGQWWTIEGYRGAAWLIEGMERTKPKPVKRKAVGIVAVRSGYPVRASSTWWTGCDGWRHLATGEHAGKFDHAWLASLSWAELQSAHSDDHEGRLKWQYVQRPRQTTVAEQSAWVSCPTCPGGRRRR